MATKKTRKRKKAVSPQVLEITISPQVTENTTYYYFNYIAVTHSRYDFALAFARLPVTLKPEQEEIAKKGKPIPVEADLQVVISPELISGLIDALTRQKDKYEARFGKREKGKKGK